MEQKTNLLGNENFKNGWSKLLQVLGNIGKKIYMYIFLLVKTTSKYINILCLLCFFIKLKQSFKKKMIIQLRMHTE